MDDTRALQLMAAVAKKDERAMEELYRAYAGIVQHFASKTVKNPTDAAEVTNEVFMELWKGSASFEGRSAVRTWLLRITHNKAVDLVRKKSKHDGNVAMDDQHDLADESFSCSVERIHENSDHKRHLETCMQGLKEGHRQVVYLTFFEELSYSDIAQVISIPAGTVKTRMMHAKQQLMSCLQRLMPSTSQA